MLASRLFRGVTGDGREHALGRLVSRLAERAGAGRRIRVRSHAGQHGRNRSAGHLAGGRRKLEVLEPRRRRFPLAIDVVGRRRVTVGQPFQALPEVGP